MDKLENLKKMKLLLDDGILTETEFLMMKNEILTNNNELLPTRNLNENNRKETQLIKSGFLTVIFNGQWALFDAKTKIFINDELHSTHSTKNGFNVKIPIETENIKLKLQIMELESTTFEIDDLDVQKNYSIILKYDRIWGKYSSKFKFSENG